MRSTLKYSNIGMRGVGVGLGDFNRGSLRGHFPLPQTHNHTARNCLYCWQLYTSQQGGRLCDFQIVQAASVVSVLYGTQCLCVLPCLACWGFPVCASTVKVIVVSISLQRCSQWICPSCKVKAFFRSRFCALGSTSLSLAFVHYNTIGESLSHPLS